MSLTLDRLVGTPRDKAPDPILRGDPITGDRYYSPKFMALEWRHMWRKVWHIGGRTAELAEAGDYITHAIGRESVLMMRQEDGSIKAFYNVCPHRGNRLIAGEAGSVEILTCAYHGWQYEKDGLLVHVQDGDDFPQGNPCGKLRLKEVACDTWGGFVWFNMAPDPPPLRKFLHPIADQLDCYDTHEMVRVLYLTAKVDCNWKIIHDNFNESYHLPTIHKELSVFVDEDYKTTQFDLYPSGHNRMMQRGGAPSMRDTNPLDVGKPLDQILKSWDLDPDHFKGRAKEARLALQQQKRRLGPGRGYSHYDKLSDEQLTDYYHYTLFPNVSLTMTADGFQVLRPQPHPRDPEKCLFDHWYLVPKVPGMTSIETPVGLRPIEEAPHEVFEHGQQSMGFVADQDLSIAVGQQLGLASQGYTDGYLSGQENRVRRFHEVINDYIAGDR